MLGAEQRAVLKRSRNKGGGKAKEVAFDQPGPRTFKLVRAMDVSQVSGVGVVGEGVVFSDGTAVMRWLSQVPTTTVYDRVEDVGQIHGHGGHTRVVFDTE